MSRLLTALLAAAALACASSQTSKSDRWAPYPGCNARQCQSWYDECSVECMGQKGMTVTECENKCRARVPECEAACPG
jgi:hypothetical protein